MRFLFPLPYMSIHLHLRVTLRAEFDLVVTCIAYDLLLLGVVVDRKQVQIVDIRSPSETS